MRVKCVGLMHEQKGKKMITTARYLPALLLVLLIAFLGCSPSKNESPSPQPSGNEKAEFPAQGQASSGGTTHEIVGPLEIPRNEISSKYGWDGSTWLKPAGDQYYLHLVSQGNFIVYNLSREGTMANRFEKVGHGYSFSGSNIQIGNLVFEGAFTWSDEKISLMKSSKLRRE